VALAVLLEHVGTGQPLLVGNVHLTWDPVYKDVKLIQAMMAVTEITELARAAAAASGGAAPAVLLGGDFNSLPDSGVAEYLARGRIAPTHSDLAGHDYSAFTQRAGFAHTLGLANTCEEGIPFTNFTHDFRGVIDYLYYGVGGLTPLRYRAVPPLAHMQPLLGCPNAHYPSDHLPLVAEYALHPPPRA
jgi:CCR4-NOT transcription complex subunit 6